MELAVNSLVPSLVAKNVFGEGEFVNISLSDGTKIDAQFSSNLVAVNLELRNRSGELRVIPLLIKIEPTINIAFRDMKTMFYDEIIMYSEILPYLNQKNVFCYPKMYFGSMASENEIEKDILIMEDLKVHGFELCHQKVLLDVEHILVSMKKIGQLHAWSYSRKAEDSKTFYEMANKLKKPVENRPSEFNYVNYITMRRGVKPFLEKGVEVEPLNKFLKAIEKITEFLDFVWAPVEPFAVIVHGDYCKNNMQFKYNEQGKPIDCCYFDFQTSKYGSPVIDLAFFLYMHTTAEVRHQWDDFLKAYWNSVEDNVSEGVKLPTFEEFLKYFSTKAVLGYFPCSFFLPMMICPEEIMVFEDYLALPLEEKVRRSETFGGEKAGNLVRDIVGHLLEKKYIHSFLEYYEKHQPY